MEKIKKQITLITTTATTTGGDVIVVPDETVSYNFKINITSNDKDFGFFDTLPYQPYAYGYGYGYEGISGIGEELLEP